MFIEHPNEYVDYLNDVSYIILCLFFVFNFCVSLV